MQGVYKSPQLEYDGKSLPFFSNAFSYRNARPVRLADLEIPEFERSPMATLLSGHRVARLVTTDGKSITYAEVQTPSGDRRSIRARCFVVAAGVIERPRLLLLSRSKWFPNGLGNASGLVGCNFVAHPSFAWHFTPARRLDASEGSHRTYALNDWARRHGMNAYHCQFACGFGPNNDFEVAARDAAQIRKQGHAGPGYNGRFWRSGSAAFLRLLGARQEDDGPCQGVFSLAGERDGCRPECRTQDAGMASASVGHVSDGIR